MTDLFENVLPLKNSKITINIDYGKENIYSYGCGSRKRCINSTRRLSCD